MLIDIFPPHYNTKNILSIIPQFFFEGKDLVACYISGAFVAYATFEKQKLL